MRAKVKVSAGAHDVTVAFVGNMALKDAVRLQPFLRSSADNFDWAGHPHIQTVAITGPFGATSPGDTPIAARDLHVSDPAGPTAAAERTCCAADPVAAGTPRLSASCHRRRTSCRCWRSTTRDAQKGSFDRGIQRGLERILASPLFIFRVEQDPPSLAAGTAHRLTDVEIASRLSFFLWSSIPDETLLARAERGTLQQPAALDAQVARMLADPKSTRAGRQLRRPVAAAAQRARRPAEHEPVPGLRRQPAAVDAPRDRAAVREHRPRGPQRPRSAAR